MDANTHKQVNKYEHTYKADKNLIRIQTQISLLFVFLHTYTQTCTEWCKLPVLSEWVGISACVRACVCVCFVERWRRWAADQSHQSREANSAHHRLQASQHWIQTPATHIHHTHTQWCPCEGYSSQGVKMVEPRAINLYPAVLLDLASWNTVYSTYSTLGVKPHIRSPSLPHAQNTHQVALIYSLFSSLPHSPPSSLSISCRHLLQYASR